jgi:hypothetical protein
MITVGLITFRSITFTIETPKPISSQFSEWFQTRDMCMNNPDHKEDWKHSGKRKHNIKNYNTLWCVTSALYSNIWSADSEKDLNCVFPQDVI